MGQLAWVIELAKARERIIWCVLHLCLSPHLSYVLRTTAQPDNPSLDYFLPHPSSLRVFELRPFINLDSISGLLTNYVSCVPCFSLITHVYLFILAQSIPSKPLRDGAVGLTSILRFQFKEALETCHL